MKSVERLFEVLMWNSRLAVVVPVLVSLVLAFGVFLITTIDALSLADDMLDYAFLSDVERRDERLKIVSEIVAVVDGYLLASILIIFSLGLYELFVNKIDRAEGSEFATRLLLIRSLDDLKDRLANVILLILIVKFFQLALGTEYKNTTDLLYLSIGLILIAGTLYLSGRARPAYKKDEG